MSSEPGGQNKDTAQLLLKQNSSKTIEKGTLITFHEASTSYLQCLSIYYLEVKWGINTIFYRH